MHANDELELNAAAPPPATTLGMQLASSLEADSTGYSFVYTAHRDVDEVV